VSLFLVGVATFAGNCYDRWWLFLSSLTVVVVSVKWWVSLCRGWVSLEIPATVGVVGVVLAPWLAALGVIAALVTNCRVVVERRE
jgi:hypothetical protein